MKKLHRGAYHARPFGQVVSAIAADSALFTRGAFFRFASSGLAVKRADSHPQPFKDNFCHRQNQYTITPARGLPLKLRGRPGKGRATATARQVELLLEHDIRLDYGDVLIRPKRSTLESRGQVNLERGFTFRNARDGKTGKPVSYCGIPIIASNMDGVGTFAMAEALARAGLFTCLVKTYETDRIADYFTERKAETDRRAHVAMSIGIGEADLQKFRDVHARAQDAMGYVCVDVANGYSEKFVDFIRSLRRDFPHLVIMAGNVVTGEMTEELILAGADLVKVGIGPGSVCTTRIQTGVGYPQLSAVIECADAAHGLGGHIIADGGCTCPGDIAKAFAGGADFVMLGGMLAGHEEGEGEMVEKWVAGTEYEPDGAGSFRPRIERRKFMRFYGMSSGAANRRHFGGLKEYRASEGREVLVPWRGDLSASLQNILGGVRSACTYCGAHRLKHLSKCATFVRTTRQYNPVYERNTIGY